MAVALLFTWFRTFSITGINPQAATLSAGSATLLTLLILFAAMGKSAQLPLTTWLPDAMAGPTPVSALIHAATMVTAGVYLLMRLFPVVQQSPVGMLVIACVGSVTAFYASLAALAQRDIKRVLAYSTMSQVGYMILAVGAGDIVGGMFHLLSHAFFKALLFLSAGCVIQALSDEHDIFKMGNLHKCLPGVFWLMLVGALCLSAFPPPPPPPGGVFQQGPDFALHLYSSRSELQILLGAGDECGLFDGAVHLQNVFHRLSQQTPRPKTVGSAAHPRGS